jgi:hypothetical protein
MMNQPISNDFSNQDTPELIIFFESPTPPIEDYTLPEALSLAEKDLTALIQKCSEELSGSAVRDYVVGKGTYMPLYIYMSNGTECHTLVIKPTMPLRCVGPRPQAPSYRSLDTRKEQGGQKSKVRSFAQSSQHGASVRQATYSSSWPDNEVAFDVDKEALALAISNYGGHDREANGSLTWVLSTRKKFYWAGRFGGPSLKMTSHPIRLMCWWLTLFEGCSWWSLTGCFSNILACSLCVHGMSNYFLT